MVEGKVRKVRFHPSSPLSGNLELPDQKTHHAGTLVSKELLNFCRDMSFLLVLFWSFSSG